jgi:hypothetical protein
VEVGSEKRVEEVESEEKKVEVVSERCVWRKKWVPEYLPQLGLRRNSGELRPGPS